MCEEVKNTESFPTERDVREMSSAHARTEFEREVIGRLNSIYKGINTMSGSISDLQAEIAIVKQTAAETGTRVSNDLAALKALVANGASPDAITSAITDLQGVAADMQAIDPATPTPAPGPTPTPTA